jgi:hypothetical protein
VSRQNPFSQHRQGVWAERGKNPALPTWLRVAAVVFGKHKKNGHAHFAPGELAKLLAKPGPDGVPKTAVLVWRRERYQACEGVWVHRRGVNCALSGRATARGGRRNGRFAVD